jgi:hypothetical protein
MPRTATDPRERMVQTGNELLNVLYRIAEHDEFQRRISAVNKMDKSDPAVSAAAKELLDGPGGMDTLFKLLELHGRRDSLLREYVTIRQTIEALLPQQDGLT